MLTYTEILNLLNDKKIFCGKCFNKLIEKTNCYICECNITKISSHIDRIYFTSHVYYLEEYSYLTSVYSPSDKKTICYLPNNSSINLSNIEIINVKHSKIISLIAAKTLL